MQARVHPRVLEQVVGCRDGLAQQYLMQCVIQGFPDDFHLGTLSPLLASLPQLQPGVRVHIILGSLLDRLARSAPAMPHQPASMLTFRSQTLQTLCAHACSLLDLHAWPDIMEADQAGTRHACQSKV